MSNPEGTFNRCHEKIRKETTVYVVGKFQLVCGRGLLKMEGIFTDFDRAVKACKTRDHFIGPIPLNKQLQNGEWSGVCYPLKKGQ